MAGIPQTSRNELIDRNLGVSPAANRYLALVSVAGTDTTAGTELSGNGYSRQLITFAAASGGATSNSTLVTFTASGGAWPQVVGIEVYTAASGGTRVYYDDLDVPKSVQDGDSLEFAIGAITYQWTA